MKDLNVDGRSIFKFVKKKGCSEVRVRMAYRKEKRWALVNTVMNICVKPVVKLSQRLRVTKYCQAISCFSQTFRLNFLFLTPRQPEKFQRSGFIQFQEYFEELRAHIYSRKDFKREGYDKIK